MLSVELRQPPIADAALKLHPLGAAQLLLQFGGQFEPTTIKRSPTFASCGHTRTSKPFQPNLVGPMGEAPTKGAPH